MGRFILALSILVFVTGLDNAVLERRVRSPRPMNPFFLKENYDPDWDLLVFTQQWPVTVCREWKDRKPDHQCTMPPEPDAWSIHGIWPTKLHTMGPSFCNNSWHFDEKLIRPIEKELNSSWVNIESETSTYGLWAHEWSKHGTCAAVLEEFNSELKYFKKGLDWFSQYNMKSVLSRRKIFPSNDRKYHMADFFNMIHLEFGVVPMIECRRENGKNWLSEIRFCFDKKLNLKDCDGVMNVRPQHVLMSNGLYLKTLTGSCNVNEPVIYAKSVDAVRGRPPFVTFYMLVYWTQWLTF